MSLSVIHMDRPATWAGADDGERMSIAVDTEDFAMFNQMISDYIKECMDENIEFDLNDIFSVLAESGMSFQNIDNFYLHELEGS